MYVFQFAVLLITVLLYFLNRQLLFSYNYINNFTASQLRLCWAQTPCKGYQLTTFDFDESRH